MLLGSLWIARVWLRRKAGARSERAALDGRLDGPRPSWGPRPAIPFRLIGFIKRLWLAAG